MPAKFLDYNSEQEYQTVKENGRLVEGGVGGAAKCPPSSTNHSLAELQCHSSRHLKVKNRLFSMVSFCLL
jgi:hypothetical protein